MRLHFLHSHTKPVIAAASFFSWKNANAGLRDAAEENVEEFEVAEELVSREGKECNCTMIIEQENS